MSTQGPHGVKLWLIEVQSFTQQLHKRMFQGMPLDPMERQAILNFATYWRSAMHPAVRRLGVVSHSASALACELGLRKECKADLCSTPWQVPKLKSS